jgi:hypothetical protein
MKDKEEVYERCFGKYHREASQCEEVKKTRFDFIQKFGITGLSRVSGLRSVVGFSHRWIDHPREYCSGKNRWVLVTSTYEPDTIESITKNAESFGFLPIESIHRTDSHSFCRVFHSLKEIRDCIKAINNSKYVFYR